jgi:hypothetical protein
MLVLPTVAFSAIRTKSAEPAEENGPKLTAPKFEQLIPALDAAWNVTVMRV